MQLTERLTQRLLPLALVGMFEDEEVVSGRIGGNPVGKLVGLCRFGVNQLNGLFLYIQPLQHTQTSFVQGSSHAQPISPINKWHDARWVISKKGFCWGSPAVCSWCVSAWVAAELAWPLLVRGRQDLEESALFCLSQTPLWPAGSNNTETLV